eukprot:m.62375 g.62375  ORF g.62375 m.62375 type:complete len:168 (-) comp23140_c2_seq5:117-620(-)
MAQTAMPLPPRYFELYTDEAVESSTTPAPPKPRTTYNSFGVPNDTDSNFVKPLEDIGFKQLYDSSKDRLAELKRLNKETMAQFMDLVQLLSSSSEGVNENVEKLKLLFTNMHHMLNEFRPHQARETIRAMMEQQLQERDEMVQDLTNLYDEVRTTLQQLPATDIETE